MNTPISLPDVLRANERLQRENARLIAENALLKQEIARLKQTEPSKPQNPKPDKSSPMDTLMLTIPVSWKGIVAQYAGRLHRNYPNKHEVRIYDYVDIHEPLCELMYRRRMKGYAAIGYKTKLQPVNQGLFAELEELGMSTPFFDGKTFSATFRNDLARANRSVIIACPNIHIQPHNPYSRLFCGINCPWRTGDHLYQKCR